MKYCNQEQPGGWHCALPEGHEGLHAGQVNDPPALYCGKYEITQGPDGMLLASDASDDGYTFAITERNLDAMVFAAGLFQLAPLPGNEPPRD
jgi:hypothetical protein